MLSNTTTIGSIGLYVAGPLNYLLLLYKAETQRLAGSKGYALADDGQ